MRAEPGYRRCTMWWMSIEVLNGAFPATRWKDAHGAFLVEAALTHGARGWFWLQRDWGVVLEIQFRDEADWARFREVPAIQAALDAVPDPVNGLLIYPGRGGSSGRVEPRRPKPRAGAGAAALPVPVEQLPPPPPTDPRQQPDDLLPV
jgi:hypothetical protein